MKKLKFRITLLVVLASVYSLIFALSIPVLCLSAGRDIPWMVVSIVLLGIGVVLLPLLWTFFGLFVPLVSIVNAIENDKIYEVDELADSLGISRKRAARRISRVLHYRLLRGYYFDGLRVHPTYRLGKYVHACPLCGKTFASDSQDAVCARCSKILD